jgi:hypothetical protein
MKRKYQGSGFRVREGSCKLQVAGCRLHRRSAVLAMGAVAALLASRTVQHSLAGEDTGAPRLACNLQLATCTLQPMAESLCLSK